MWAKIKSFLINSVLAFTVGIAAVPLVLHAGQSLEAKWFPVVTNYTITNVDKVFDGVEIDGYYDRKRLCPIEQIVWESNIDGVEREIPRAEPYKQNLRLGINTFRDFKLFITKEYLATATKGTAYYNCHPFWLSKTVFYDPASFTKE